ncbi:HAMP domain-containing sensor histidine kinase [Microbacterium oxydans]|uniref:sensor histidine kinase n=1 Tax=Microbacterium TaxID=33882 RepID=UPI00187D5EA4|nr:HAMP domain-containing sensor histidine kinase [Microbacterium sp. R1]MBE7953248.1 HAMP domain-containing histidine kinase [Microbacterium sp. R1]
MTARRRLTLRTAIALALIGSTVAVSVLVTGVVVFTAGRIVYESRQQGLLDEFSTTADALFTSISTVSPEDTWSYYAEILPGETVIIDLGSGRSAGELRPDQVPDALRIDDSRRSGEVTSLMTTLDDREVFFVSVVRDDLPQDPSGRLAVVTAYSMQPQQEQVRELVVSGVLLSAGVVVLVVLLERLLGGALTRPLRRLVDTARAVGSGEGPPAWKPSFDDVDRVADALRLSSERLGDTIGRLRQREAESRQLVSDVAHELRTPLTSMMAVDEMLDDDEQTTAEERVVATAVVRMGTRRLHTLIEHLLELSRLDAGVARVHRTTVVLHDLLADVVDTTGVDVDELSVAPSLRLRTDAARLHTVVANLLTNASRHGRPPVVIRVREDGDVLHIDVGDHGPGIAGADSERVFDRFVTTDRSRSDGAGTGLGLAIARDNARLLGGDLALLSGSPGATFRVTVPRL